MKSSATASPASLVFGAIAAAIALFAIALFACKPKAVGGGMAPTEACQKLEEIWSPKQLSAAQKDECLKGFTNFAPDVKVCMDACVTNSKTEEAFKACSDVCDRAHRHPAIVPSESTSESGSPPLPLPTHTTPTPGKAGAPLRKNAPPCTCAPADPLCSCL